MNILYINNVMEFGGVEKCIIQLTKNFKQDNKVFTSSSGGPLIKEFNKMNIPHFEILDTDSKSPITIIKNLIRIYKIIKNEEIDLVHSHHRMTTLYCKILLNFLNFKLIHTQHLCIEDKVILTRAILKNLLVITVSNGAKENLINKYGLDERNIKTIYNTVETYNDNYTIDDKLLEFKKNGNFIVSHISRLVNYKGIYDFIEIAENISKKEDNIKFVLIGDGEERENLLKYIVDRGLNNTVYYLGSKDNIINQLEYIDLLLLCSYIEGLPLTPIEAFYNGVPVIATDIKGTNEEVDEDINGYLIPVKNIDLFVDKILDVYNDKDKYKRLAKSSVLTFKEKFNEKQYISNHRDIYYFLNNL